MFSELNDIILTFRTSVHVDNTSQAVIRPTGWAEADISASLG